MATLDDILTTQKNGVVAINNLSESLTSFYAAYLSSIGNKTSTSISSASTVVTGTSRLVSFNVTTAGSSNGTIFDSYSATVTNATGTGTAATLTYNGYGLFAVGDLITVVGMNPSGYNTTNATVTGITNTTVTYANATSSAFVSGGTVVNSTASRIIAAIPQTVGNFAVGSYFKKGITVIPGTGQVVTVNYYTS